MMFPNDYDNPVGLRDPYFTYSSQYDSLERYNPYSQPPQNLSDELTFDYPHAGEYLTDELPPVDLLKVFWIS